MNRRSLLLLASFTLAACGAPPMMDASTDAPANDSADELIAQPDSNAVRDSAVDGANDVVSDAAEDAASSMDAALDSAADAAIEAGTDAAMDASAVMDADAASAIDAGRDAAPDAVADSAPDVLRVCTPMMTRSCYTGSASTRGVGVCRDGVETCAADGSGWSACVGQVLPSAELCATVADEDCNGSIAVCEPSLATFARGVSQQTATAIAVDATGNFAIAGQFTGTMDLGTGPLVASGTDGYVAMYSSTGALRAVQQLGGAGVADVRGLVYDAAGDLYAVGSFSQVLTPLSLTSFGGNDAFVESLSSTGAVRWSARFGDAANQEALAVALSSQGLIVGGRFAGSISIDRTITSAGSTDGFVVVFDPATTSTRSLVGFGSTGADEITAVAANATDFVIAGNYTTRIDFNGTMLGAASTASFVTKLSPSLTTTRWAQQLAATSGVLARGVAMNASGAVTTVGEFSGAFNSTLGTLTSAGAQDAFVLRHASDGSGLWARRYGGASAERAVAVSMTESGDALIGGHFSNVLDFGATIFPGMALVAPAMRDGFVAKLNATGAVLWARHFTTANDATIDAVASGADGSSYAAGSYAGTVNFGAAGSSTSAGQTDAFIVKIPQ